MIQLQIELPDNLIVDAMLEQQRVPCVCVLKGGPLTISFVDPLPAGTGTVDGLTYAILHERAQALTGGNYLYFCFGMISLRRLNRTLFEIMDLSFFDYTEGWRSIVESGTLAPPLQRHTQEELDAFNALYPLRKTKKKR
jgi:hypothetical protein